MSENGRSRDDATVRWLLEGDPSIRWQTLRDVVGADPDEVAAEREKVERHGWGAQLLDAQDPGGTWGGTVWKPQDRDATDSVLLLLVLLGADCERTRAAAARTAEGVDWGEEWEHAPFFDGEVEPCINGRVLTAAAPLGFASETILGKLLDGQQTDGGWNCYADTLDDPGSFHSTICVVEALAAYRDAGGPTDVAEPLRGGQEYLLERGLMRRKTTGEIIDDAWLEFAFPYYWHYDVLRGLDHLRTAGVPYDDRLAEAVAHVASRRRPDGRWSLDRLLPGRPAVPMETVGEPSRWITLRALRVLDWAGVQSTA
ncbi:hypothetical protein [Leifsonia shinshuensis]|uniref:hypothetical protein n=1 Tax=Leifsonia shinshuensis TaxID=150026 RepID=UPI0028670DBF|nr:hypothetical protein [Leifsonia shinshuensis]MDR6969839.1 hypothetical protein [Leifsonia shinshuensis]